MTRDSNFLNTPLVANLQDLAPCSGDWRQTGADRFRALAKLRWRGIRRQTVTRTVNKFKSELLC